MSDLMRAVLDSLMPPGSIWQPVPDGDMDHLLDGVADNLEAVRSHCAALGELHNPYTTPYLEELERDYGLDTNTQLTDAERRQTLALVMYVRRKGGTLDDLQEALDRAGYGEGGLGLHVYANDPPADPGPFTDYSYRTMCGQDLALCGYNTGGDVLAVMGVAGGLFVVNGDVFATTPAYLCAGNATALCGYNVGGDILAVCGRYLWHNYVPIIWETPADALTWPLVFFVAPSVTRDGTGMITAVTLAALPDNRRQQLIDIIIRWKPMHTWCALMCVFQ